MPRIRSIKPEHWGDKYLPNISLGAHLLWISMWNFSDDKGIIERDYELMKANTFPRRKEVKPIQIEKWVKELIKYEFVIPFQHKDIQYLIHRTFDVHQKIDRPQPSKISDDIIRRVFDERSTNEQRTLDDDSTTIRRKDRIGEDRIGEDNLKINLGKASPPENLSDLKYKLPFAKDYNGLPDDKQIDFIRLVKVTRQIDIEKESVESLWEIFKNQNLTGKKPYSGDEDVYRHFSNWGIRQPFRKKAESKKTKMDKNIVGIKFINDFKQCEMSDGSIQDLTKNQIDGATYNQINPNSIVKK